MSCDLFAPPAPMMQGTSSGASTSSACDGCAALRRDVEIRDRNLLIVKRHIVDTSDIIQRYQAKLAECSAKSQELSEANRQCDLRKLRAESLDQQMKHMLSQKDDFSKVKADYEKQIKRLQHTIEDNHQQLDAEKASCQMFKERLVSQERTYAEMDSVKKSGAIFESKNKALEQDLRDLRDSLRTANASASMSLMRLERAQDVIAQCKVLLDEHGLLTAEENKSLASSIQSILNDSSARLASTAAKARRTPSPSKAVQVSAEIETAAFSDDDDEPIATIFQRMGSPLKAAPSVSAALSTGAEESKPKKRGQYKKEKKEAKPPKEPKKPRGRKSKAKVQEQEEAAPASPNIFLDEAEVDTLLPDFQPSPMTDAELAAIFQDAGIQLQLSPEKAAAQEKETTPKATPKASMKSPRKISDESPQIADLFGLFEAAAATETATVSKKQVTPKRSPIKTRKQSQKIQVSQLSDDEAKAPSKKPLRVARTESQVTVTHFTSLETSSVTMVASSSQSFKSPSVRKSRAANASQAQLSDDDGAEMAEEKKSAIKPTPAVSKSPFGQKATLKSVTPQLAAALQLSDEEEGEIIEENTVVSTATKLPFKSPPPPPPSRKSPVKVIESMQLSEDEETDDGKSKLEVTSRPEAKMIASSSKQATKLPFKSPPPAKRSPERPLKIIEPTQPSEEAASKLEATRTGPLVKVTVSSPKQSIVTEDLDLSSNSSAPPSPAAEDRPLLLDIPSISKDGGANISASDLQPTLSPSPDDDDDDDEFSALVIAEDTSAPVTVSETPSEPIADIASPVPSLEEGEVSDDEDNGTIEVPLEPITKLPSIDEIFSSVLSEPSPPIWPGHFLTIEEIFEQVFSFEEAPPLSPPPLELEVVAVSIIQPSASTLMPPPPRPQKRLSVTSLPALSQDTDVGIRKRGRMTIRGTKQ